MKPNLQSPAPKSQPLLLSRRFLPLFITQFTIAFNDNLFRNALIVLITFKIAAGNLPADPKILASIAAALLVAPYIFFSSIAGEIADRYERSRLMRITKIFELFVMMLACYAFYTNDIYLLLGLLFLAGTTATFFSPMKYSVLPNHLKKDELVLGNGLIEGGTFLAILTGSILGTTLGDFIEIGSPETSYYVCGALIIIAILGITSSYYIPPAPSASPDHKININLAVGTFHILRSIIKNRILFKSIIGSSWFWLCGSVMLSLFPAYVKEVIGANTNLYAVFLSTFSIGIAIGATVCSRILRNEITPRIAHISLYGVTIFTLALVFLSNIPFTATNGMLTVPEYFAHWHSWPIFLVMVAIAFCWGLYSVPLKAIIQHNATDATRSRVIAGENVFNSLFMVGGNILVSVAIKSGVTILEIFAFIGVANILVAIITRRTWKGYSDKITHI